ncbi:MAG: rod shape-determining protein MreC, partial [Actinomycetota bacterium]|nr:rod shape-determining protein MreC [Actinomycetota bacterium]
LAELEEARQENERLRALVEFAEERNLAKLGARVIQRPLSSWEGVVVIDRGSEDGVEPGMPIIAAQGLVGQVAEVSARSSTVRLITDQQSGVAAMIQSTRALGVMRGSVGGALSLDFVDRTMLPQVGDVVLTSGLGGVYPKGIVVGDVVSVDDRRGELYPRIGVTSRVPVDLLEEVFVLVGSSTETDAGEVE